MNATERAARDAALRTVTYTERRDRLIRQAHTEGTSLRRIAELVGLSPEGVRRIIQRG